jgi:ArsR family transcriptional regulator
MFSAMGTEPRLRIMQVLLSAHPQGMVVGEIQSELDIPIPRCPITSIN